MADMLCCTCSTPTSCAHLCKICQKPCHAIEPCAISCGEEGFGTNVICSDCFLDIEDVEEVFGNYLFGSRLLIWDSFRAHISKETKETLRRLALHTAVISGGTTKYIQVPDVSWNSPFKNSIREQHTNWMVHGQKLTTSSGNLKAPPIETYLEWICMDWIIS
uniref:DDE-1 domain-containing protein n=1 Tax=Meloidogyne hapla TaxID=6305 RepID=A0A1I8BIJ8_MELHA